MPAKPAGATASATHDAVAYVRVSTNKQERGYSPQTQRDGIRDKAAALGLTIVATISEHYSGDELDRDGLARLYAYLKERNATYAGEPVRTVVVYCMDRWARSTGVQLMAEYRCRLLGAEVVYVQKEYTNDDSGQLLKMVDSWAAGVEKSKIIERTVRGKYGKAAAGYVNVGDQAPYGYAYISEPHKGRLEVYEAEADTVRVIYRWYARGPNEAEADGDHPADRPLSIRGICELLHVRGVKSRRGRDVWRPAAVHAILTSRTYIGEWTYGKVNTTGRERVVVAVPAIIDPATFVQAQARIEHNRKYSPRNSKRVYLLSGRAVCGHCGTAMTARTDQRNTVRSYYRCNSHTNTVKANVTCPNRYFRCDYVDGIVWAKLRAIIEHPAMLTAGIRQMQAGDRATNDDYSARLSRIERETADLAAQDDRLLDELTRGLFTVEQIRRRKAAITERRAELDTERASIRQAMTATVSDDDLRTFEDTCQRLLERMETVGVDAMRAVCDVWDVEAVLSTVEGRQDVAVSIVVGGRRVRLN